MSRKGQRGQFTGGPGGLESNVRRRLSDKFGQDWEAPPLCGVLAHLIAETCLDFNKPRRQLIYTAAARLSNDEILVMTYSERTQFVEHAVEVVRAHRGGHGHDVPVI